MSASYQQTPAAFSVGSGNPSGSITPVVANDSFLVFEQDGASSNTPAFTSTGSGSWSNLGANTLLLGAQYCNIGYNLGPIGANAQTITATNQAGGFPNCFPIEYIRVGSYSNAGFASSVTPGTGAGAILGTSVAVPAGSLLVALCIDQSSGTSPTAALGTARGNGSLGGRGFVWSENAGTGAAIQPAFTSTTGATSSYIIIQAILNPLAAGSIIKGTAQSSSYLSGPLTWTPSPQPAVGSGIIIPFTVENCGGVAAPTITITDNQAPSNTYTNSGVATNPNGNGTIGGLTTGVASLDALPAYTGTLTFTLTPIGGSGRTSIITNHLEVAGGIGSVDKSGLLNGGATAHGSASVTASGANTNPVSVVVACMMLFNGNGQFAVGSDPPSAGYTSAGYASLAGNAAATDTTTGDIGYKLTSALETSSALWPVTGSWGFTGQTCASIVTFPIGPYTLSLNQGGFSLGGQTLGIATGGSTSFILLCAPGSFNLVGSPAYSGFQIDADEGVFSLTGQSMDIAVSQFMFLDQGSFGMAGQALGANQGYIFTLDQGGFSLTGQLAALAFSSPTAVQGKGKPGGRVILQPKKLGETSIYQFDFISALASNEVISSGVVMAEVFSGTDPSPSSIISGGAAVVGTQLQQRITGGVLGVIYEVLAVATTSLGNTIEISGYLAITPDLV